MARETGMGHESKPVGHPFTDRIGSLLMLALAAIFFGGEAHAKSIYVSPAGHYSNPGTLARPVATAHQAMDRAEPGDTIHFRAGRYQVHRFIWIDKEQLTLTSYQGERAVIFGGNTEASHNPPSIIIVAANNVSLVNLDIEGGSFYGVKVDVDKTPTTSGVIIRGCRIYNTGRDCIKTFNADNLLIEDCEIGPSGVRDSSNAEGIDSIASVGVTIRNCYVHDAATTGIYLKGGARDGVVERNRVERVRGAGILLGQDTDDEYMRDKARHEAINCVARNNLVIGAVAAGIGTYSGSNVRFENNTVYDVAREVQAGLYVVTNHNAVPSERVAFKNNIVHVSGARPVVFVKDMADQLVCESNIYYNARGPGEFWREMSSGGGQFNKWNLGGWRREMRVDARSQVADPLIDASDLCKPRPGSPAIDRGEAIAGVKSDYSGIARPQGTAYDIGAHERRGAVSANGNPAAFLTNDPTQDIPREIRGKGVYSVMAVTLGALGGGVCLAMILLSFSKSTRASIAYYVQRAGGRTGYKVFKDVN